MHRRKPHRIRSGMARVRVITQFLPATHTFIHEWNEPSCLYSVSIHQMASPDRDSAYPTTAHYSFIELERMKGWVGLVGWHCRGRFTNISGQWSPVSCRSSVGQGKFAGYRPTFYHCATQPTGSCRSGTVHQPTSSLESLPSLGLELHGEYKKYVLWNMVSAP